MRIAASISAGIINNEALRALGNPRWVSLPCPIFIPTIKAGFVGERKLSILSRFCYPRIDCKAAAKSLVCYFRSRAILQHRFGAQNYIERTSESLARSMMKIFASRIRLQKFTNCVEFNAVGERDDHLRSNYVRPVCLAVLPPARPHCGSRSSSPA